MMAKHNQHIMYNIEFFLNKSDLLRHTKPYKCMHIFITFYTILYFYQVQNISILFSNSYWFQKMTTYSIKLQNKHAFIA